MMPGLGEVKPGGKRSGQTALLRQHDQTLHTGDRMEIQVKAVVKWGGREGEVGDASPPGLQRDVAGCHSKKEAVKNFSFLLQTFGGQRSGGKTVQMHVLAGCCLCGGVGHVVRVWQGGIGEAE